MIRVERLTKVYAAGKGIRGISFQVKQGETLGLLGPNGAGKTTIIRLLMGFIRPQAGTASINCWDCWQEGIKIKQITGYLPGEIRLMESMSGEGFLNLVLGMHGGNPEHGRRKATLRERLAVDTKQPIGKMSKGMKQKLGIIAAFMLDPQVLVLDEPTSGLDPLFQKICVDMLLEEKARGKTILMSSHMFPEIERTCDRVGMICAGELLTVADVQALRQSRRHILELEIEGREDADRVGQRVAQTDGLSLVEQKDCRLTLTVNGSINPLVGILEQVNVREFNFKALDLEEIFRQFYQP